MAYKGVADRLGATTCKNCVRRCVFSHTCGAANCLVPEA